MTAYPAARALPIAAAAAAALATVVLWGATLPQSGNVYIAVAVALAMGGVLYLAWNADPAWSITVGLVLAIFLGQWDRMGVPTVLAPDRAILLTALVAVMFRAPGSRLRRPLTWTPLHWLLAVGVAYVLVSAAIVGTLLDRQSIFIVLERYGVIPFLLFLCAPVVFTTPRQRNILLGGFVAVGAYLGVIAVLHGIGLPDLVVPHFIVDEDIGTHADRARGPFLEAGTNGLALFACGAAATVAAATWRTRRARRIAGVVVILCAAGVLFTLTRQIWLGALAGTIAGMLTVPEARKYLVPSLLAAGAIAAALLLTVPGLSEKADERRSQQGPINDRFNQNAAAINAIEKHPLVGVGWQNFVGNNEQYIELLANRPLSGTRAPVHNVPLTYASELGLIGASLWLLGLLIGVGTALRRKLPRSALPWKALLAAVFVCYLVIANFELPAAYPNFLIWLLAGVVLAHTPRREAAEARR